MSKTWRVAVSGLSPAGLFHLERLSLCREIRLAGAFDTDPQRLRMADGLGCPLSNQPVSIVSSDDVDVLFLIDGVSVEAVTTAIVSGLHVVIDRPWLLSSAELRSLDGLAASSSRVATIASLRRWSTDFLTAMTARQTGRLGTLQCVKYASCEKRVPGEKLSASLLREFGYHWLDQLLVLTESTPTRVFSKRLGNAAGPDDAGFLTIIDFANGCTAQIDVNTKSRLGHRTGWMLEGDSGSYRSDRLYTETADGEIVDEPIHRAISLSADPLLSELICAWREEQTTLPTLADAARVVQLIEAIEQSADRDEIIRF